MRQVMRRLHAAGHLTDVLRILEAAFQERYGSLQLHNFNSSKLKSETSESSLEDAKLLAISDAVLKITLKWEKSLGREPELLQH